MKKIKNMNVRVGKVPLVLGDVDARMVGVGRVVQTEADLGLFNMESFLAIEIINEYFRNKNQPI